MSMLSGTSLVIDVQISRFEANSAYFRITSFPPKDADVVAKCNYIIL